MWRFAFSLGFFAGAAVASPANLQSVLAEHGVHADFNANVTKDLHLNGAAKKQHLIEAETGDHQHFTVKVISPLTKPAAETLIKEELRSVHKLFEAAATPYMGDIAAALGGCPRQYGPLQKKIDFLSGQADVLMGSASETLSFGACSPESAKYKAALVAYYDQATQSVWMWRVFVPWTEKKSALKDEWLAPVLARFKR